MLLALKTLKLAIYKKKDHDFLSLHTSVFNLKIFFVKLFLSLCRLLKIFLNKYSPQKFFFSFKTNLPTKRVPFPTLKLIQ